MGVSRVHRGTGLVARRLRCSGAARARGPAPWTDGWRFEPATRPRWLRRGRALRGSYRRPTVAGSEQWQAASAAGRVVLFGDLPLWWRSTAPTSGRGRATSARCVVGVPPECSVKPSDKAAGHRWDVLPRRLHWLHQRAGATRRRLPRGPPGRVLPHLRAASATRRSGEFRARRTPDRARRRVLTSSWSRGAQIVARIWASCLTFVRALARMQVPGCKVFCWNGAGRTKAARSRPLELSAAGCVSVPTTPSRWSRGGWRSG